MVRRRRSNVPYFLSTRIKSLWLTFLTNAHPLIKLFFDWEIAPIIDNAVRGIETLKDHESALVVAIAFVGTVTITEDQCLALWGSGKSQTLSVVQQTAESALLRADYAGTTRLMTLQAFILYLIGLHNRARPTILFSLLGIASRIAERLGVHRNGESLGLSVLRSEERRRVWWQMQLQEIYAGRLVGKVNLTLIADWDATIPANIDDGDLDANSTTLPEPKKALTSMAPSLWLYRLFQMHCESMRPTNVRPIGVSPWTIFSQVSVAEKDELIDRMESKLRLEFLQHCDLLDPSHLYTQHGINHFVVSARRATRQPALVNAKISEMSQGKRDEKLGLCLKTLEYYIFLCSTEALQRFRWHSSFQFQMLALIYIILEAYHRGQDDSAARLWSVIERVYAVHPTLAAAEPTPEIRYVSRITLAAWWRYQPNFEDAERDPSWITDLSRRCDSRAVDLPATAGHSVPMSRQDSDWNFDFDLIDWSTWAEFDMSQGAV